jgi:hypothetical protein
MDDLYTLRMCIRCLDMIRLDALTDSLTFVFLHLFLLFTFFRVCSLLQGSFNSNI